MLLGICCKEELPFSHVFIYSVIYLDRHGLRYLFWPLGYTPILHYLFCFSNCPSVAMRALSSWFLCPFDTSHPDLFKHFLTFWHYLPASSKMIYIFYFGNHIFHFPEHFHVFSWVLFISSPFLFYRVNIIPKLEIASDHNFISAVYWV